MRVIDYKGAKRKELISLIEYLLTEIKELSEFTSLYKNDHEVIEMVYDDAARILSEVSNLGVK